MNFTTALTNNIRRTFTFAFVKNKYNYKGVADTYDPIAFFINALENQNPFKIMMELEGFAYKRALENIHRYEIPYTPEQERKARIFHDVTTKMQKYRSDYIKEYIDTDDLKDTGIVLTKEPYYLTTQSTIYVAKKLKDIPKNLLTTNTFYRNKLPQTIKPETEQYEAIKHCLNEKISCLIGGAGTGKSFVTATIIDQLKHNELDVVVLAPTHKAREALQDKLDQASVRANVRTIHSFVHNPENAHAIVVDEAGMLSTPLLEKLLSHYVVNQQYIFIGDKNQIPPVEYGRPFEKIQELFPTFELKQNHRSESADIIALGREILGKPQNANMNHPNIEVVATSQEAFKRGAQVALSFTNRNVQQTNEEQRIKNGKSSISPKMSVGDIIIAKTNNRERGYFNGQIFELITPNKALKKGGSKIITFKTSKDLEYNFDLAYGLTIHKSQGSEWDVVAYQPSDQDTKNLAYVAVTRAKKRLIIIGDELKSEYKEEQQWRHLDEINCI